ncbi:MAG: glycoside hydrolase family 16 protein [Solirubrobacterales bacterium]
MLAASILAFACSSASAGSVRLVATTPGAGKTVAGDFAVRAKLSIRGHSRVLSAHFYVNKQSLGIDTRRPFRSRQGATFSSAKLRPGENKLKFKVVYRRRGSNGHATAVTAIRTTNINVFHPTPSGPALDLSQYKVIFDDEFSSQTTSQINWQPWRLDWTVGGRPYNNLEGYGYSPANSAIRDGSLQLTTSDMPYAGYPHSTGSVNTRGKFSFKYGYIEARVNVPNCDGCWPAFWMLPTTNTWPPEIDVLEIFDTSLYSYGYAGVHWAADDADGQDFVSTPLVTDPAVDHRDSWHTYGLLWTPTMVVAYVDGLPAQQFPTAIGIPAVEMYPIIQLAVYKDHHPAAGSRMLVDYVRVWQ